MIQRLLRPLACLLLAGAPSVLAQFGGLAKVPVSLVAESSVVEAGKPFTVALRLQHPPGYHTYWINPGIGQATKIDWKLPDGWRAGPIVWPIPKVYDNGAGPSHVYEGDTYLLSEITPPATFTAGTSATLGGQATWFECTESGCARQSGPVTLTVTAGAAAEPVAAMKAAFDSVRAQQPQASGSWKIDPSVAEESVTLTLTPQTGANADPGEIYFYESANTVELGAPKVEKKSDGSIVVSVVRTKPDLEPAGFLHASKGWLSDGSLPALALPFKAAAAESGAAGAASGAGQSKSGGAGDGATDASPTESPTTGSNTPSALPPATEAAMDAIIPKSGPKFVDLSGAAQKELTVMWALVLAALGGLILNAMPCVFPVLGLKVLGFVQQSGENAGKVRIHGLVFTLGLLVAMWVLAGVLIWLNATGAKHGWGFQQQSPGFMAFIISLLFLLGLNLAGVFEWGTGLVGVGGGLMEKQGLAGSFFTGALTTLVATPCSGPFLGAAMGFSLRQPPAIALLLFTAFGLGIALPYLVLSLFPSLVRYLPRPGAWMETFKVAMAFPMLATVVYFLHSFGALAGRSGVTWMLVALLLLALGAWIYGRWTAPHRSTMARRGGLVAAVLALVAAAWTARDAAAKVPEAKVLNGQIAELSAQLEEALESGGKLSAGTKASIATGPGGLLWEKWSPERVEALRKEGRIIYVDFTAEWCATCQVNKKVVFESPGSQAVKDAFAQAGVVALKADKTDEDPVIDAFLFRNGLFAIPVNFIYPADASRPPIMLPEGFLTQGMVLEGIEKAR